jgi:hypothetical protein
LGAVSQVANIVVYIRLDVRDDIPQDLGIQLLDLAIDIGTDRVSMERKDSSHDQDEFSFVLFADDMSILFLHDDTYLCL